MSPSALTILIATTVVGGLAIVWLRLLRHNGRRRAHEAARENSDALERGIADRTRELESAIKGLRQEIAVRQEVERKLRGSEERYKMVSRLSSDLSFAFLIGDDGKITWEWITRVVAQLTGYELEELAKLDWREIVHPDDVRSISDRAGALLGGRLVEIGFRIVTKSGDIRWLESNTLAKRNEETGAMRAIGAIRDVSDRKLASELRPTPVQQPALDFPVGGIRVLVVDDEEAVRELAREFLERADFEVFTADGGSEALKIFDTRSEEIDVVLLDLSMPDVDGRQTYAEIRRRCPDVPVILVSGYSEEMVAESFAADSTGIEFLAKPYTADDLVERIRHCTAS